MPLSNVPYNFFVQTANQQNLLTWDVAVGADTYDIERSTDGITYSALTSVSVNEYLDESVTIGTSYFYRVASANTSGTSQFTAPQMVVPTISGEMCLSEIRQRSQQKADMVNSRFVDLPEWNKFINLAYFELYDLLATTYEDYFCADPVSFTTNGTATRYPLPNGVDTFQDESGDDVIPRPFYKLLGVDMAINPNDAAYITLTKFDFQERNKFVFPNSSSNLYGLRPQYRVMGDKITFIPAPASGQTIRLWFIPRLEMLLRDTDLSKTSISGWIQYVICRAAKYALEKEESDTSSVDAEILFLKTRIEQSASNRDVGMPDTITNTRRGRFDGGSYGDGFGDSGL